MDLTQTTDLVAAVAVGVAVLALILVVVLAFVLRRLRKAQRAVLGEHGDMDLVAYSTDLGQQFAVLTQLVEDVAARLETRVGEVERRQDLSVSRQAVVRYDAYGEQSGHQSASIALLNTSNSGIVLSSIIHRDQARLYAKPVEQGEGDPPLSPEEVAAVKVAGRLEAEPQ